MDRDDPRKRRRTFNLTGHAHELTFSCFHRLPLLSKDRTRRWFIETLDAARRKLGFEIWAYVIMPDHAHVLVFPKREPYDIAAILKAIKQPVARRATNHLRREAPGFLERLRVEWPDGRIEYRFWQQGGGHDRNVVSREGILAIADYFHRNPVRKGLVSPATEWIWSSARFYAGLDDVVLAVDRPDLT